MGQGILYPLQLQEQQRPPSLIVNGKAKQSNAKQKQKLSGPWLGQPMGTLENHVVVILPSQNICRARILRLSICLVLFRCLSLRFHLGIGSGSVSLLLIGDL